MTYLLMLAGLVLLLIGANYLVDSSVAIAKRAKISDFVIGLTIVGFGTSSPELFISLSSALKRMGDIALGNVLGSNICNVMLILGATAVIKPVMMERSNIKRDVPITIAVSLLLTLLCYSGLIFGEENLSLTRISGAILLICFAAFMIYAFKSGKNQPEPVFDDAEEEKQSKISKLPVWLLSVIAVASLGLLVFGGDMFIDSAVVVAKDFGMSDFVISTTIIAVGTSLPELITCIVAALKGNPQIALGNVLGSNIFNILMILGVSTTIMPIHLTGVNIIDFAVMVVSAILVYIFAFTLGKRKIDRAEGVFFVLGYIAYIAYLLNK